MSNKMLLPLWITMLTVSALHLGAQHRSGRQFSTFQVSADTIFVYDTIFVTDTIRVYRGLHKMSSINEIPTHSLLGRQALRITTDEKILIISTGVAATFSPTAIIDSTNIVNTKNFESMKKVNFLGVMLFAFQNMVLAQNNFSFNAGTGIYRNTATTNVRSRNAATLLTGIGYSRNFAKDKLRFNADLNYHFLFRSDFGAVNSVNFVETGYYTKEAFDQNYHLLSLPVSLQLNRKWCSPFIGAEVYYKQSQKITSSSDPLGDVTPDMTYYYTNPGAAIFAGIQVPLYKRIALDLKYTQGITPENESGSLRERYTSTISRFELNLRYLLK